MANFDDFLEAARQASENTSKLHEAFLKQRATSLRQLAQLTSNPVEHSDPDPGLELNKGVFSRTQLEEFATGSISRCFGPEYLIFEGRRYPRIPNHELLLMDRVVNIQGARHQLQPGATITTQFHIPSTKWFGSLPGQKTPYFTLMEMALQPCGFLSAYLGTAFIITGEDMYFRNLDGKAVLHYIPALHGKTISARAVLQSSAATGKTIIQKYSFSLSLAEDVFYEGESSFGYFPLASLMAQSGLDGNREAPPISGWSSPSSPLATLPNPDLPLFSRVSVDPIGSASGLGSILVEKIIDPHDWFFSCHFYQDPVMPGSLGIEAMFQAVQYMVRHGGIVNDTSEFSYGINQPVSWKYRGQVLPSNQRMLVEAVIEEVDTRSKEVAVTASANLWADRVRIYHVDHISLVYPRG